LQKDRLKADKLLPGGKIRDCAGRKGLTDFPFRDK
jgi:hypothetical protein